MIIFDIYGNWIGTMPFILADSKTVMNPKFKLVTWRKTALYTNEDDALKYIENLNKIKLNLTTEIPLYNLI